MGGGENLIGSPLSKNPGEAESALNYELNSKGSYVRFRGYERLDGRPSPSAADYRILNFVTGVSVISVGDIVTGTTSSAYGEVIIISVTSGSFATNDAAGFMVLDNIVGSFVDTDPLEVAAVPSATASGVLGFAATDALDATYRQAAIEARRAKIAAVPGSGPVRGVWNLGTTRYAFRDNAGATAGVMHKSTAAGWTVVDLGAGIPFNTGSVAPVVGEIVTGAISGAFGTVVQAVVTSGSWAGGTAAGTLYVNTITGTFQAEGVTGSVAAAFNATGAQVVTTIAPGGHYEFQNYNFYGDVAGLRMYGVSGVDKAFQFDGSGYVPISTGMSVDTPSHLRCHRHHLFLSFAGSLQHSLPGKPLSWSARLGAGELGIGDAITSLDTLPGDVLGVMSRNSTHFLYGSSIQDWNLVVASFESGAIEWTAQQINTLIYMDDLGVTNVAAAQVYGDFASASMSEKIQPLVLAQKPLITASMRVKAKDQYRLFYSDKTYISATFSRGKLVGWTHGTYNESVSCACSTEDSNGDELLLFGSDNGFVYQSDVGTSFDGVAIDHVLRMAFYHLKSPAYRKKFFKSIVDIAAPTAIDINVTMDLDYADPSTAAPVELTVEAFSGGGFWGSSYWEAFSWDSPIVSPVAVYLTGTGKNVALTFTGGGIYDEPHTIQGITYNYARRGIQR